MAFGYLVAFIVMNSESFDTYKKKTVETKFVNKNPGVAIKTNVPENTTRSIRSLFRF